MNKSQSEGWFITFEGPDGSGKSTQIGLLAEHLNTMGYDVLQTREPGGTDIGDQIRDVLHSLRNEAMHPHTEVLLYMASRAQLVEQIIRPHLMRGPRSVVLSDRYADSSLAYQGYGHQLDLKTVRQLVAFATDNLKPRLTVYFDIDAEEGLRRRQAAASEGAEWNRLDAYELDFHRRVRAGFHELIAFKPERWIVLDGARPIEEMQEDIRSKVMARLTMDSA